MKSLVQQRLSRILRGWQPDIRFANNIKVRKNHIPGQPVHVLGIDEILAGGDLLPNFSVAVKTIFEAAHEAPEQDNPEA